MPQNDDSVKTEEEAKVKKEIHKDDDIAEEEKEPEKLHLKTKTIPAVTMLIAGLVVAIDTYFQKYTLKNSLIIILVTMVVFLIVGDVIKLLLDRVEIVVPVEQNEEEESSEDAESEEPQEASADEEN